MFVSDKKAFVTAFQLDKDFSFYKNKDMGVSDVIDYRDWRIDLGRQPTCFKFYFWFRCYGVANIRDSYREREKLGIHLERLISESPYFELFSARAYNLVCFQVKHGDKDALTKEVAELVSDLDEGFMTCAPFKSKYILRWVSGNLGCTTQHVDKWWGKVCTITQKFLESRGITA